MEDQINEIQKKFNDSLQEAKREAEAHQVNDNESSTIVSNSKELENISNLEDTMNNTAPAPENASSIESKSSSFEEVTSGSSNLDVDMAVETKAESESNNQIATNNETKQMQQSQVNC